MANRDQAQALKDQKPIDYHMLLCNKFKEASIFEYEDYADKKCTVNKKTSHTKEFNQQDYQANRVNKMKF